VSDAPTLARAGRERRRTAGERPRRSAAVGPSPSSSAANRARPATSRGRGQRSPAAERARREREVSLLDMIDRLLAGGVVIHGDITLAVADVDLVYLGLRAVIASADKVERDLVGPLDRPRKER
jgi:hypothetical protein